MFSSGSHVQQIHLHGCLLQFQEKCHFMLYLYYKFDSIKTTNNVTDIKLDIKIIKNNMYPYLINYKLINLFIHIIFTN